MEMMKSITSKDVDEGEDNSVDDDSVDDIFGDISSMAKPKQDTNTTTVSDSKAVIKSDELNSSETETSETTELTEIDGESDEGVTTKAPQEDVDDDSDESDDADAKEKEELLLMKQLGINTTELSAAEMSVIQQLLQIDQLK